ncbi:hypothetical protein HGH92_02110 [Chitinophaga varians]|uniref:Cytochrome c domain-containing protein n=1 Tax=Chitinophaga varians TaxID=2202339 RepID=A0A847RAJ2_9BACT|nr:hypothetical protein [Chitinophaga varians]NLR63090.1 hypothetical protein [Chitinophaga varians]
MKYLIILLALLSVTPIATATIPEDDKEKALLVLQTKCNICHVRNNPFRIFKERNMERNAKDIYKQVFVKGRMPLGNEVKLTEEERETLKKWLEANIH